MLNEEDKKVWCS